MKLKSYLNGVGSTKLSTGNSIFHRTPNMILLLFWTRYLCSFFKCCLMDRNVVEPLDFANDYSINERWKLLYIGIATSLSVQMGYIVWVLFTSFSKGELRALWLYLNFFCLLKLFDAIRLLLILWLHWHGIYHHHGNFVSVVGCWLRDSCFNHQCSS